MKVGARGLVLRSKGVPDVQAFRLKRSMFVRSIIPITGNKNGKNVSVEELLSWGGVGEVYTVGAFL